MDPKCFGACAETYRTVMLLGTRGYESLSDLNQLHSLWLQLAVSLGHFADDSISHSLSPNSLYVHSFVEESNIWIFSDG